MRPARLSRNFVFNLAGFAIPLALAVLALPLIASRAGDQRLGFLTLAWAVIGYFGFLDLGLSRVFARRIARAQGSAGLASEMGLLRVMMAWMFAFALVVGGVLFVAIPTHWLAGAGASGPFRTEVRWSWLIVCSTIPAVTISNLWRGAMEGREAFDAVNLYRVIFGSWMFAGPLAVLAWTDSLQALVGSLAFGRWAGVVAHWSWCHRHLPRGRAPGRADSTGVVRAALVEGGWITVSSGLAPLMAFIDRFVLAGLLPLGAVAVYSVPEEMATRLMFIPCAIALVLFPRLASLAVQSREDEGARIAERATRLSLAMVLPACVVAGLFAKPALKYWLGDDYAALGAPVLRCLLVGMLVNVTAQIALVKLQAVGRARSVALVYLAEVVPYCAMLWPVAERFGVMGVAIVWTGRMAVDAALMVRLMRGVDRRSFGRRTALALLAALAAMLAMAEGSAQSLAIGLPQAAALGACAVAIALMLSPAEWREAGGLLRQLAGGVLRRRESAK